MTAIAEIVGCHLPWLIIKKGKSAIVLLPAAASLAIFVWLLTLHPTVAGRTYAAYGGVYVSVAIGWLWFIGGQRPDRWDITGVLIVLTGVAAIALGPRAVSQ